MDMFTLCALSILFYLLTFKLYEFTAEHFARTSNCVYLYVINIKNLEAQEIWYRCITLLNKRKTI